MARITGGGWDWIHLRNGKKPKPEPTDFDGENPAVRVHALLGTPRPTRTYAFNAALADQTIFYSLRWLPYKLVTMN
jgi:hypothetical protein